MMDAKTYIPKIECESDEKASKIPEYLNDNK